MYAVQVLVVPALPVSPIEQGARDYYLPDHLICETDHVINYISVTAESVPCETCHIEEDLVQVAKECPEITAAVDPPADQLNRIYIHIILVTLICVVLFLLTGFGVALFLFFGGVL